MKAGVALLFSVAVAVTAIIPGKQFSPKIGSSVVSAPADSTTAVKKPAYREPKGRPYVVIDCYSNRLYLRTGSKLLLAADCSTGSGGELIDSVTGRRWTFETPRGVFTVSSKLKDPWWRKPDWAFIEEGEEVPENETERFDSEMLGEFAIGFGDGYFIHGTLYERLLGIGVTHGCVRLGTEDLRLLYEKVDIGTHIYVY